MFKIGWNSPLVSTQIDGADPRIVVVLHLYEPAVQVSLSKPLFVCTHQR